MESLIQEISKNFGIDEKLIANIVNHSSYYYRKILIPKRKGGYREIYLPAPEIKAFQHFIVERYLSKLPVSDFANGYIRGKSIIDNVKPHIGSKAFLKTDIENFFNSISYESFRSILLENREIIPNNYVEDILKILTYKKRFEQGSVSSPIVSNIYMNNFDNQINEYISTIPNGVYTRYSDDITISSISRIDTGLLDFIEKNLKKLDLKLNLKKTFFTSDLNSIRITGLNIVKDRLCVGTRFKKELKNQIHHTLKNKSYENVEILIGKLMYLRSIEPIYFNILNLKYASKDKMLVERLVEMKLV